MDPKSLDRHLQSNSYIEGVQPSQADLAVFESLAGWKPTPQLPHLSRWYNHIASFGNRKATFPGEKKDLSQIKISAATVLSATSAAPSTSAAAAAPATAAAAPAAAESTESAEEKSEKQKKNDEKKKAKMEKFLAKQQSAAPPAKEAEAAAGEKKEKKPKEVQEKKKDEVPVDATPKGKKKILPQELPNSYHPKYVESAWYDWWETQGYFKPEKDGKLQLSDKGKFVIPIPPPNVTGSLHLGHALTNAIQDALTRWHRMRGETTLWNPGCDHAGIATQVAVEKKIMRETGQSRHDLGREAFVKKVWEWKDQYGDRIYSQLRRLGSSVDWDRAAFTMDPKLSRAVLEAFVRLFDMGLIYRSTRLVNWCSKLKTAISNLEVDYKELPGRTLMNVVGHDPNKRYEFGVMIHFAYKLEDSDEEIVVATTRPETMLGDTAITVHPEDERYKKFHGKKVVHPYSNRRIPIIPDAMVDRTLGTGAVKITPAHDPNDYECGKRNNLPFINILNDDGTINENGGEFKGLLRFDCRTAIVEDLKKKGLFRNKTDNPMSIPVCSRTGDIVEAVIRPQWYVKCDTMSAAALKVVEDGELEIIPSQFKASWARWLENPVDWCISRQLWWGHRIPAYHVKIEGSTSEDVQENWVVARTEQEALQQAYAKHPGVSHDKIKLEQDPDVLDTWFSSGLFPFSIFGWPEQTEELKLFYPNTLLETGHDILFFWVARMVMMGITLTGQVPFKQVYLHAMVRDAHGRKMSKSLGNVIDPIDVIEGISLDDLQRALDENTNIDPKEREKAKKGQKADFPAGITECGTDALRFALCAYTMQARDINLDVKRVEGYRHFCNKIWNAFKFSLMNLGANYQPTDTSGLSGSTLTEKWILSRLNAAVRECNEGFQKFTFPQATTAIYNFWLYELCDYYLEIMKPILQDASQTEQATALKQSYKDILYTSLDVGLRLLHPFMPFVTEELYQRLPRRPSERLETISLASYPEEIPALADEKSEKSFKYVVEVIEGIRSLRASYFKPKDIVTVYLVSQSKEIETLLREQTLVINTMAKAEIHIVADGTVPIGCVVKVIDANVGAHLLVKGKLNVEEELVKLRKTHAAASKTLAALQKAVADPNYEKIPEAVKQQNEIKLKETLAEVSLLESSIKNFESLEK